MASNDKLKDIEDETKLIFECYVEDSLEKDKSNNVIDPGTPGITLDDVTMSDKQTHSIIVKRLLEIAGQFEIERDPMLKKVLNMVNISEGYKSAFQDFSDVAQKVLESRIDWNAIVYLFRFGYLIARDRLVQGARDFLQYLCRWMLDIFRNFSVFDWISRQGGWNAVVRVRENTYAFGTLTFGSICAVVGIIGFIWYRSRSTQ